MTNQSVKMGLLYGADDCAMLESFVNIKRLESHPVVFGFILWYDWKGIVDEEI